MRLDAVDNVNNALGIISFLEVMFGNLDEISLNSDDLLGLIEVFEKLEGELKEALRNLEEIGEIEKDDKLK